MSPRSNKSSRVGSKRDQRVQPISRGLSSFDRAAAQYNLDAPACKRLISRAFSSHEVIPLIEAIFENQGEVKMIGYLCEGEAQTFIDVIYEVRPHTPSKAQSDYPRSLRPFHCETFVLCRSGPGSPRSPATITEEVFEYLVQDMRLPGFTSEVTANSTLLRSVR